MNDDEIYKYAAGVRSRIDFVKFVELLNVNFEHDGGRWENNDLKSFLAGLSGFAQNMGGYYKNMGEEVDVESVTWRMAAQMLLAASVYGG